jgi:dipeptidyl aminopeptidase/acylaminoacyl peptidase
MTRMITVSVRLLAAILACQFVLLAADDDCAPAGELKFVCGPSAVEDLVAVPDTHWIVGSGMTEMGKPGKLHLIDAGAKTWEVLYPGANPQNILDTEHFPACPGAPDPNTFGAHGIAVSRDAANDPMILAVNHGREAIEVFRLNTTGAGPAIKWVGCVLMDDHTNINSVAFLPDGGFVATTYYDPKAPGGFGTIFAGGTTGGVVEWHRETGVKPLPGTDVAGANGIEVSRDGKFIYVSAWGSQEIVRFSRGEGPLKKDVVKVGFCPDNLRWAPDGKLLVAGQNTPAGLKSGGFPQFKGWTVGKFDPDNLKFTEIEKDDGGLPFQNVSVAIEFDSTLWMGVFMGNRVAYRPSK